MVIFIYLCTLYVCNQWTLTIFETQEPAKAIWSKVFVFVFFHLVVYSSFISIQTSNFDCHCFNFSLKLVDHFSIGWNKINRIDVEFFLLVSHFVATAVVVCDYVEAKAIVSIYSIMNINKYKEIVGKFAHYIWFHWFCLFRFCILILDFNLNVVLCMYGFSYTISMCFK